mmetsp:Transcript_15063/g.26711  ORF Transcript_15063/g.26711 Transcript_15063/m.26711 type:complete len:208 (-) Transcript_15063:712-1335(-)
MVWPHLPFAASPSPSPSREVAATRAASSLLTKALSPLDLIDPESKSEDRVDAAEEEEEGSLPPPCFLLATACCSRSSSSTATKGSSSNASSGPGFHHIPFLVGSKSFGHDTFRRPNSGTRHVSFNQRRTRGSKMACRGLAGVADLDLDLKDLDLEEDVDARLFFTSTTSSSIKRVRSVKAPSLDFWEIRDWRAKMKAFIKSGRSCLS